jgi:electron transfer flavoprotein alpha subunit
MKTLVFIDNKNGKIKKASLEAVCYAAQFSTDITAVILGECPAEVMNNLSQYGVTKIMHANNAQLNTLDSQAYSKAIINAANASDATCIIFSNNNTAKAIAPRVAAGLQAGLVSGAVALPDTSNGFTVKKSVFSGKAFCYVQINTAKKVICITPNSFPVIEKATSAIIENFEPNLGSNKITVTAVNQSTGRVPLPEAELVVSGGRGLKGPEHWGILEDLATALGAEMACSRPVADSHWRPHHEHVGQTGGTIRPNLYIAVGISGAIQHLAGVNGSKTIVVINKDSEAPFFKAADYGVCADAFEVLPKLTEAVNKYKASIA